MSTRRQRSQRRRPQAAAGPVRATLSVGALLALGIGIAAVPTPASATAPPVRPGELVNKNPDFDPDALRLSTTTDTLPAGAATQYQARVGDPVQRVYVVHNNGLLPLENVTVSDPGADGAAIRCGPGGTPTIATLLPLSWISCEATFTAMPGQHDTTATASGTLFLLGVTLSDQAAAGYTAVAPALSATLSLNGGKPATNLPAGSPVAAVVTVLNSGSATLTNVGPLAPQPPLSILGCNGAGSMIGSLGAGQSAFCTGALIPAPGANVADVTITGTWQWNQPITAQGPQSPRTIKLQTVAAAPYTGIPVTSPTPPPPPPTPGAPASTPTPPPPTPTPTPSATPTNPAAVFPPLFPPPTPSPTLHTPTPFPAPLGAAVQAVSQFKASRGLSLPLRVLVIIIIPVVAAAAGARRMASRR